MSVVSEQIQRTKHKSGTSQPILPRVNLLPPEIAEAEKLRRVKLGLGGGVLAAVGVVAVLYVGAMGGVGQANTELEAERATGTQLQAETAKYADVRAVYTRAAAAEQMLVDAMGQEVRYSSLLNDLSLSVPDKVWLENIAFTQTAVPTALGSTVPGIGTVTFTGVGFKHDDVATWLESLATQKGYVNPYFTNSTAGLIGTREIVRFTSSVTVNADALSGRYAAPKGG